MSKWKTVEDVCARWRRRYARKGFGSDTLPALLRRYAGWASQ